MRIPGINYHDRTSMEVTLICYRMAVEEYEKALGLVGSVYRDDKHGIAAARGRLENRSHRADEPGGAASLRSLPSKPNPVTVAYLTDAIKKLSEAQP